MKIFAKLNFYFYLGLKNIDKYKRRSLQIVVIIFLGAMVISVISGFSDGLMEKYLKDLIETTAHGKIFYKGYYKKQEITPLEFTIKNYQTIVQEIKLLDPKTIFSPTVSAGVVLSNGKKSVNLFCRGILPYVEEKNFLIFPTYNIYKTSILKGEFFSNNSHNGIIISSYVATNLDCSVGDKVIIFTLDSYGSFNAIELSVIGIFNTGYLDKDQNFCFTNLASLQKLLGLENQVTEIALYFDDIKKSESFYNRTKDVLEKNNLEFYSWKKLLGGVVSAIEIGKKFQYIMYLIFVIVASVGIMNTVLITVFDRIRDIGTLRAVGYSNKDITFMIIVEVFILGITGALLGTIIGGWIVYYFSIYGIPISENTKEIASSWLSSNKIYPAFRFKDLVCAVIVSSIVPVVASFYPLLVIGKMKIKELLDYL